MQSAQWCQWHWLHHDQPSALSAFDAPSSVTRLTAPLNKQRKIIALPKLRNVVEARNAPANEPLKALRDRRLGGLELRRDKSILQQPNWRTGGLAKRRAVRDGEVSLDRLAGLHRALQQLRLIGGARWLASLCAVLRQDRRITLDDDPQVLLHSSIDGAAGIVGNA